MRISQRIVDELVAHAREEAPRECCGLIASRHGEAIRVFRCSNAAESETRYEIDGLEQWQLLGVLDRERLDLGGIYHSHTRADPYPSEMDIANAFHPEALYLIVGVGAPEPVVRAFWIRDGQVDEEELPVRG